MFMDAVFGMEQYVNEFYDMVMYDIFNHRFAVSPGEKHGIVPCPDNYVGGDERFYSYETNISSKIWRKPYRKVPPRLETIFNFLKIDGYRFEDYFHDEEFHYPFPIDHSEIFFEAFDKAHVENTEKNLYSTLAEQATANFCSSVEIFAKDISNDSDSIIEMLMFYSKIDRVKKKHIFQNRNTLTFTDVLRVSYNMQIPPYMILGLKRLEYPTATLVFH